MIVLRIKPKSRFGQIRNHVPLLLALGFFTVIYLLIAMVNHYNFRTYSLDLGAYTNALFDYAHLQWNDCGVFRSDPQNLLADHFDLYLILLSPLYVLFGTPTLLIVQIVAVLGGGVGVYRYFSRFYTMAGVQLWAAIHFWLFFGIYSAVAFDYHSNVVAAMLLPWFFYYFRLRQFARSAIFLLLMLIAKENISLWMIFVCAGMMISFRRDKKSVRILALYTVVSLLWFLAITAWVMPALAASGNYTHLKYSALGTSLGGYMMQMIAHPLDTLHLLFVNHSGSAQGDFVKLESHIFIMLSGGLFLLFRPQYLLMLIPVYCQKMFHDKIAVWGVDGQYSVEFIPIISICAFGFIARMRNAHLRNVLKISLCIFTLAVTARLMDNTQVYSDKSRIRFYQARHYNRDYDVQAVHRALNAIPDEAVVSCQSPFLPHLALRDKIYQFPIVKDAEYIVLSGKEGTFPLSQNNFDAALDTLMQSTHWEKIQAIDEFCIWKKKSL